MFSEENRFGEWRDEATRVDRLEVDAEARRVSRAGARGEPLQLLQVTR